MSKFVFSWRLTFAKLGDQFPIVWNSVQVSFFRSSINKIERNSQECQILNQLKFNLRSRSLFTIFSFSELRFPTFCRDVVECAGSNRSVQAFYQTSQICADEIAAGIPREIRYFFKCFISHKVHLFWCNTFDDVPAMTSDLFESIKQIRKTRIFFYRNISAVKIESNHVQSTDRYIFIDARLGFFVTLLFTSSPDTGQPELIFY